MHKQIIKLKEQGLRNVDIAKQLDVRKSTITYHLSMKYHGRDYYLKRQRSIKQQAVDYKGGKCIVCGYNKYLGALQFHHTDPAQKDPLLRGKAVTRQGRNFEVIKPELDKCVLLCSNCHAEVHGGLVTLPI